MKLISILFTYLFFISYAFSALPPTSLSGLADTTKTTTFNFKVPNKQSTKVSTGTLIETGNSNILTNPSFEHATGTTGWSLTSGTFVDDNSPISGVKNAQLTLSSQSLFFSQDSTLYASQFADGVQGLASIRVRTSVTSTPIYVCYRQAGNTGAIGSGCVQVQANGKWGLYKVPFILGGTSNGIAVTSNGVALTGDVEVDDAFVGAVDLKQDINVVGAWKDGTCTSGHTTNTVTTCKYRQVGDSIEVQVKNAYSGAPNAANLTFGIPSGFTINTSKIASTSVAVNQFGIGTAFDSGVAFYQLAIVYGTSTTVSALVQAASGAYVVNGSANSTIPFSLGASDEAQATFMVPVNELNGASSVYSTQNADTNPIAFTPTGTWTTNTTYTGTWYRKGAFAHYDINIALSGAPNAANLAINLVSGHVIDTAKLATTAANKKVLGEALWWDNGSSAVQTGSVTYASTTTVAPLLQRLSSASNHDLAPASQTAPKTWAANDNINLKFAVPIVGWDQSNVIIGTFKDAVTSQGSNSADIQSVYFGSGADCETDCNSGTCTICSQTGTKITSVTAVNSTGSFRLNGIDGTKYNCTGTGVNQGVGGTLLNHTRASSTTSYAFVQAWFGRSGNESARNSVICIGTP